MVRPIFTVSGYGPGFGMGSREFTGWIRFGHGSDGQSFLVCL